MQNQTPNGGGLWKQRGIGLLLLLTFINLFNYLDRYILVALSPSIKKELELSDLQVGFLATAFMFSYFLIAPVFGWLGDRKARLKLMAFGVGLWSFATVGSGLGRTFPGLLASRFGVGVGEAAYGAISPSVITDLFPRWVRGRAFAIFFMAIPVGSALGFLLGGLLEKLVGWRQAFFVAGVPGLLLALLLLFAREPKRGAQDEEEAGAPAAPKSLALVLRSLRENPTYVLTTVGYCAYTFVVGGIAVWIPHYIERYLGVSAADGNMAFGAITVVAGFLGTILGGAWADRWVARDPDGNLKLSALSMFLALPVFVACLTTNSFIAFAVMVFALEFLLFLSTSPINAQTVNCVPSTMRAMANATSIFCIHMFGDAISPPLVGGISDVTGLRPAMLVFAGGILVSAVVWALKPIFYWEAFAWPKGALELPKVQVHRGLHPQGTQENTLDAFRAAANAGAKMVELDVHLSADGIPVVVHDKDIQRIAGRPGVVAELSAAELKAQARVPSLEEVFRDPALAGLAVNVEIKSGGARTNGLEAAVARVVQACGVEGRILFSSFNPLALRRLAKLLPQVPRALLATNEADPQNKFYLRRMLLAFLARPHMLNYDGRFLTERMAQSLVDRKIPFAIWTVDDPAEAKKFLALGAKSIISPDPDIV